MATSNERSPGQGLMYAVFIHRKCHPYSLGEVLGRAKEVVVEGGGEILDANTPAIPGFAYRLPVGVEDKHDPLKMFSPEFSGKIVIKKAGTAETEEIKAPEKKILVNNPTTQTRRGPVWVERGP